MSSVKPVSFQKIYTVKTFFSDEVALEDLNDGEMVTGQSIDIGE